MFPSPNKAQVLSAIKWVVAVSGAGAAGWLAKKLQIEPELVQSIFQNEALQLLAASLVASIIPLVVSLFNKTEKKQIEQTEQLPTVQSVITKNSVEGRKVADEITSPNVVSASDVVIVPKVEKK